MTAPVPPRVAPSALIPAGLPTGLVALVGEEGSGKTRWLRALCGDAPAPREGQAGAGGPASVGHAARPPQHPDALWLDLALPGRNADTPHQVWQSLQARCPRWDPALHADLVEALALTPHLDKQLFMLSTGSRRKVAIAGLLAAGAAVTCLDQPYGGLDAASARVLREFLADMAQHPTRTWVVADYEADPRLPWSRVIPLP